MSYLGTNKVGKMYLGSTIIGKAYLGDDLVYDSAGGGTTPVLPYDAEVEYLISDGNQYIDTGIIPDANTGVYAHVNKLQNADGFIIGLRDNTGNTRWCIGNTVGSVFYNGYGTYNSTTGIGGKECDAKLNWLNDKKFYTEYGSTNKTSNLPALSFTPVNNIRLFGSAGVVASYSKCNALISFCKISQGSDIVMDLIPVRVGQVGYMYDKVSGELFGNNGTGSFTLGNDK